MYLLDLKRTESEKMNSDVIYDLLKYQEQIDPNAIAIIDGSKKLTRKELSEMIDIIAAAIPKDVARIGVMMDHSAEMIATLFAVLKLNKTYVPVEPSFPQERIKFMMQDAGAGLVITEEKYKNRIDYLPTLVVDQLSNQVKEPDKTIRSSDSLAYILYTSGSTGKPKGVAVTNKNVTNYIRAFQNEFNLNPDDVMLQYSVCSFDIFVEEVFASLLNGATLAIPSVDEREDMDKLVKFIEDNNVSVISGFPYLLLELNHLEKVPDSLRLLISGGDVLRGDYVDSLVNKVTVYNTYGPSETTVCATYFKCNDSEALNDGTYPVGKPIQGVSVEILDENLNPVKEGESGEIFISGYGVSDGYVGDREEENKAFFTAKDGSRKYRSGDIGYYLPDGNIAFLHRKDSQIMIEGRRVEPAEVENVIVSIPEVEKAAVRSNKDTSGLSYMTAYVVFKDLNESLDNLVSEISEFLPSYMIPEFFVRMKDLPVNANGKVDNKLLPIIPKDGVI